MLALTRVMRKTSMSADITQNGKHEVPFVGTVFYQHSKVTTEICKRE
jgi:hypothetical protein